MKPTLTAMLLLLIVSITGAQSFKELSDTQFTNTAQYKASEDNVINSVGYLFSTPNTTSENRSLALQFIMKWMKGTPDHNFTLNENVSVLTEDNETLLALYKAGMAKIAIRNPNISGNELHVKTAQLLAEYCANKRNKLKPTAQLKKVFKNQRG